MLPSTPASPITGRPGPPKASWCGWAEEAPRTCQGAIPNGWSEKNGYPTPPPPQQKKVLLCCKEKWRPETWGPYVFVCLKGGPFANEWFLFCVTKLLPTPADAGLDAVVVFWIKEYQQEKGFVYNWRCLSNGICTPVLRWAQQTHRWCREPVQQYRADNPKTWVRRPDVSCTSHIWKPIEHSRKYNVCVFWCNNNTNSNKNHK